MRAPAIALLVLLAGCGPVRLVWAPAAPPPPPPARVVTCGDLTALAAAVVDGRRRGQSRREQRLFVAVDGPASAFHAGLVESVYDWPRPRTEAGWTRLTDETVRAAAAHCLNRPGAALRGVVYR